MTAQFAGAVTVAVATIAAGISDWIQEELLLSPSGAWIIRARGGAATTYAVWVGGGAWSAGGRVWEIDGAAAQAWLARHSPELLQTFFPGALTPPPLPPPTMPHPPPPHTPP
ncbi:MAG: hypothetical protein U0990_00730 [Candidatus Nanopelagicales bacterium]|nr:hypothetical protein [Candidatus Nanopelagicales bacterium]MDZ4248600.1 hypothetical protein [Candidatus Nanopelagicales bacterium]